MYPGYFGGGGYAPRSYKDYVWLHPLNKGGIHLRIQPDLDRELSHLARLVFEEFGEFRIHNARQ